MHFLQQRRLLQVLAQHGEVSVQSFGALRANNVADKFVCTTGLGLLSHAQQLLRDGPVSLKRWEEGLGLVAKRSNQASSDCCPLRQNASEGCPPGIRVHIAQGQAHEGQPPLLRELQHFARSPLHNCKLAGADCVVVLGNYVQDAHGILELITLPQFSLLDGQLYDKRAVAAQGGNLPHALAPLVVFLLGARSGAPDITSTRPLQGDTKSEGPRDVLERDAAEILPSPAPCRAKSLPTWTIRCGFFGLLHVLPLRSRSSASGRLSSPFLHVSVVPIVLAGLKDTGITSSSSPCTPTSTGGLLLCCSM
eukprot:scaffold859_cov306-Pinguiococcus_pyrenoidosus.AAC.1